MTIIDIINSMNSSKPIYINTREVRITFFDELTKTIEIEYLDTGLITYVTNSSLSDKREGAKVVFKDGPLLLCLKKRG